MIQSRQHVRGRVLVVDWRNDQKTNVTTPLSACARRPSSSSGGGPASYRSHDGWVDQWGQVG